jgi:hypothetical protein
MSMTMAAVGLLFAAVTTGQELIDQVKATKLINDVKTIEMHVQRFAQLKHRLPGDCDADGVIDYAGQDSDSDRDDFDNNLRASFYSYSVQLPTIPAADAEDSLESDACALIGATITEGSPHTVTTARDNANVWINDLKMAGVVSDSTPNRIFAKMVNEDFLFVGKVTDPLDEGRGATAQLAAYNAIVIHNVPQWMARRLSTTLNGQDARADRSRVRLLTRGYGSYSNKWDDTKDEGGTEMRDSMVTVVYFFDRVPESKRGGT